MLTSVRLASYTMNVMFSAALDAYCMDPSFTNMDALVHYFNSVETAADFSLNAACTSCRVHATKLFCPF